MAAGGDASLCWLLFLLQKKNGHHDRCPCPSAYNLYCVLRRNMYSPFDNSILPLILAAVNRFTQFFYTVFQILDFAVGLCFFFLQLIKFFL